MLTLTPHPDVFWALKGGLCNFGIVTAMDIKTFPTGHVWGGSHIIAPGGYDATFATFSRYLEQHGESQISTASLISAGKKLVMVSMFYDGP